MLLDQSECGREPSPAQAIVVSNGQLGFEPELGLAFNVLNVHVSPEFLAGEEEEPIPANPENRGTHNPRIPEIHMRRIGVGRGRAGSSEPASPRRPAHRAGGVSRAIWRAYWVRSLSIAVEYQTATRSLAGET